jgi:hypothetical protein
MDNITLQAQILTVRSSVDAALTTAQQDKQPPPPQARWSPGDQMSARVEAALPGGRFHVRVDDVLLEMNLPDGFKAGDRIALQFVSADPRPSFVLNSQPEPQRPEVQLSNAGRALGEILKSVEPDKKAPPATVKGPIPLLPAPSADAPQLAVSLSKALSTSGIFYESHQSQWVLGERPVTDLLNEPQGKLSLALRSEPSGQGRGPASTAVEQSSSAASKLVDASGSSNLDRTSGPSISPVHQDALPQVRSQLHALETQQLVWQGQLWPGQDLEWSIRDPGEERGPAGEAQPWFTQLRLRLPQLGALTADLALVDRALRIRLSVPSESAQKQMSAGHEALASALSAAGIDLISFKVAGDGD